MDPTYYVLIIATATIGGWFTPAEELVHLPGYTRHECEKIAAAVPPPKAAKCEVEPPSPPPIKRYTVCGAVGGWCLEAPWTDAEAAQVVDRLERVNR